MKKKTFSFLLFGILTLLLVSASLVVYLIDWNKYRSDLAELASDRLGVRVELAGDLTMGFWPRPAISAQAVRLSPGQADFNDTIATADKIDMHLGLAALLRGSMELQSLAFEGLTASLVETPAGWSIEGWPALEPTNGEQSDNTLLSLDRFRIKSGSILVRPVDRPEIALEGLDLILAGKLPTGPLDWEGSAIVTGQPISVSGRFAPTRTKGSTSVRMIVSIAQNEVRFSGRVSEDGAVTGRFQAGGSSLDSLLRSASAALGDVATFSLPALPYSFDAQIDRDTRGVSRVISRQLSLGEARGTLDLTVAQKASDVHITGSSSFGIIPLDNWLAAIPASGESSVEEAPDTADAVTLPVAGSIDVSVEGVEYRGEQVQQVQALVSIGNGQLGLQQFGALLPGASRLAFRRDSQAGGEIQFQSGGLQDVFEWMGIPVSDAVPAGRLRTADLVAHLSIADGIWVLSDVNGSIDTSSIVAEVSGQATPFAPTAVRARVDTLNLDAYWPDARLGQEGENKALPAVDFDFSVDALQWLDQRFQSVKVMGLVRDDSISLNELSVEHNGGKIDGSLSVDGVSGNASDITATVGLQDWTFPIVERFAPIISKQIAHFSLDSPVSGSVAASGPSSSLQVRAALMSDAGSVEVAGALEKAEDWQGRLQGTIAHRNLGQMMSRSDLWSSGKKYSIETALNLTLDGTADQYSFNATGDIAGAQLTSSGSIGADGIKADVSIVLAADKEAVLDEIAADYGYTPDVSAPRRFRASVSSEGSNWAITDFDVRNGAAAASGNVAMSGGSIGGAIYVQELNVDRFSFEKQTGEGEKVDWRGAIDIHLENVSWMGQRVTAPRAQLTLSDDQYSFTVGETASLNADDLALDVSIEQTTGALRAAITAKSIDIGAFASKIGASGGFSGSVSTTLDLAANMAADQPILNTLAGEGSFNGGAGSLYFMAVPDLIRSISSSDNASGFLGAIGSYLRGGQTDFANFRGAFRLDSGVALVDEIIVSGNWGQMELDGQVNLPGDYINVSGNLAVSQPLDAPNIPVVYEGPLSSPNVRWTSRALEQFAIAGIERRLRTRLFGEFEQAQADGGEEAAPNPGAIVSQLATGLLSRLRSRQAEQKRVAQEKDNEGPKEGGSR